MKTQSSTAFTLLEMMITIAIIAILVTLGVPAFFEFSQKQAISAAINTLHNDLLLARSHAVYEGLPVVACPGNETSGCTDGIQWSDGWIVFADPNADRTLQVNETVVRSGMAIEHMAINSSSGRTSFRFYPNGSTPGSNGSISFCGRGGPELARKLIISNLGRIRRDDAIGLDSSKCPSG
jgi:type IV fimbrial biogenesis protein FimT